MSLVYLLIPGKTFVEGVVGQPASFVPAKAVSDTDKTISRMLYRGLFRYDNFGTLIPDLAETWTTSDGGLVYTITIKDNQYWSDGSKISSDDLIYTAFKASNLSGVATDKIDERTVRYTLPNKFSPFLSMMTLGVMKNGSLENSQGLYSSTSGPFRVASVKQKGDVVKRVILINSDNSAIKQISFRFYASAQELETAYKLGEIHAFLLQDNQEYNKEDNETLYQYPVQSVYYALFFNLRNEANKDSTKRTNMAKTLNIKDIIGPYGIPVEGAISRNFYTNDKFKADKYDDLANFDFSANPIAIDVPSTPALVEIAQKIQSVWEEKLKTNVTIRKHSTEEIKNKVIEPRFFDILLFGQEVGRDPDRYVNWHSTQAPSPGLNLSGFSNVRADRALEEGRNELDQDARRKHYDEFQRIIYEQTPAIFLHHPYMNYYVSNRVKGIGEKYTFTSADRFLDFNNWSF